MRNSFLKCDIQLRHLMGIHDPKIENGQQLAQKMYEAGIFADSEAKIRTENEIINNKARSINNHLDGLRVSIEWVMNYCDFFHCSADYLIGYISAPTHETTDICEQTGLWEENLPKLKNNRKISRLINALLSYKNIDQLSLSFDWMLRLLFPCLALRAERSALEKRKGASLSENNDISDARNSILGEEIDDEDRLSRFDRDTEKLFREFQAEITNGTAPCLERIDKEINGK